MRDLRVPENGLELFVGRRGSRFEWSGSDRERPGTDRESFGTEVKWFGSGPEVREYRGCRSREVVCSVLARGPSPSVG